jgi:hypothetical protein
MPRHRQYDSSAARQAAYRMRARDGKRNITVTNRDNFGDFMERLTFIRDTAGDVSRDNVRNWRGWRGSEEMHAHALQQDIDDIVSRLDALLRGDNAPFLGAEWAAWRARREANGKIH